MQGPSPADISELEIGDTFRVVADDGEFQGIIKDANPEDGLVFENIVTKTELMMALADVKEYTFYPIGETIHAVNKRRQENLAFEESIAQYDNDPTGFQPDINIHEEATETSEVLEVGEDEADFFELYEKYENLPPVASQAGETIYERMLDLSAGSAELIDALSFAVEQRNQKIKDHLLLSRKNEDG